MKTIKIGAGAGFAGDRLEPAVLLAEQAGLDYLVLECLAERTIALAQQRKIKDPDLGYDPLLTRRIESLLPSLVKNKVKLISNMGAANPMAAAKKVQEIANKLGYNIKIAAVTGDDVLDQVLKQKSNLLTIEDGSSLDRYQMISANAYIGIEGIVEALEQDADVIIVGRVADPSLFLAPMVYEFGWDLNDHELLGKGTIIGHLLECAGQLTGGYFADPVNKPVPDLDQLGFPFATIDASAYAEFTKLENTGGMLNLATVKEQLLYEVLDPHAYLTPDSTADFTSVQLKEIAKNKVALFGGGGTRRSDYLKVSVGYSAFFQGEGEISYAGAHALERAQLAESILKKRLGDQFPNLRTDLIGLNALHKGDFISNHPPYEIRLRVAAKANTLDQAKLIGEEVEALYTNGPAGGGGARKYQHEQIGIVSVLIPRSACYHQNHYFQS